MEFKLTLFVWACVQVGSVAFAQTNTTCRDVSDEVDELLGESDYLEFNDMVKPQVDGFQQDINLAFLGFDVIRGSLEVTNGTLSGLDSMSRSDYPSSECWTEDSRSLQGVFGYDTLTLSYSSMKTTFWFGEITGRLSCQISPTLSMTVTKKTDDCRLEVFTFTNPVEIDYDFSIDGSSWKGWILVSSGWYRRH
ncbi:hypothetical protein GE061_005129 [Apolygus lucorum]|uniref:Uncharacterized protein n=1 Tax=Apolygus lucorum TaxID=248454 RepID=A0A6A4IMS6_APOLU|nr:hypothetical protein GE061_005129 [Apolygus lucorum]